MISLSFVQQVNAQEAPPKPISIYADPSQGLNFGSFYQGMAGGTVTIFSNGARSVSGDIIEINSGSPFTPAIFEVEATSGTFINILNGPDILLTGSNGGSMLLHLGTPSTGFSFISSVEPPAITQINIGGTLTIGSPLANPSGNYSGIFSITFIQE
ncbi:MAG: DUF4402 domain-containing protein [Bacteroidetes bacterium]|nr:DUF4402 domain-containing protein [Bacteroidota bacterium]